MRWTLSAFCCHQKVTEGAGNFAAGIDVGCQLHDGGGWVGLKKSGCRRQRGLLDLSDHSGVSGEVATIVASNFVAADCGEVVHQPAFVGGESGEYRERFCPVSVGRPAGDEGERLVEKTARLIVNKAIDDQHRQRIIRIGDGCDGRCSGGVTSDASQCKGGEQGRRIGAKSGLGVVT